MNNKKILIFFIILFAILFIGTTKSEATLKLKNLDFDVQINSDSSMDVKETWNIQISDTNTLFKTFKKDNEKYTEITDVKVKDVTNRKEFAKINREMYHVTKDCYYALTNSSGQFEIAWGVGLDDNSDTKTYEISYTVKDAIKKYNDYSELYWQFIGDEFEIKANKIKGTILLPKKASNREDIRVWGHTKELNGEIYVTDLNKIEFSIDNYSGKKYVEVRALIPNDMISEANRISMSNIFNEAIREETIWADTANKERQIVKFFRFFGIAIASVIMLYFVIELIKNIKQLIKMDKKIKPTTELDYYRDLPYEDATPAEALFALYEGKLNSFESTFSATILDLCLKKYIALEAEKEEITQSDIIKITILDREDTELKKDEKLILDFLKEVSKDKKELTTSDITLYLKSNISKVNQLIVELEKIEKGVGEDKKIYIRENDKKATKYKTNGVIYIFFALVLIYIVPLAIILFINGIVLEIIASKINIFTQKGIDEKEQWKAFKKYMEEFSLLKEKKFPSLVVWEKYLIFATAFGISEKVLKQLKVVYPEITDMSSTMYSYTYINIMNSVNIENCISSSISSAYPSSSGSGFGGGFSGGGGGGRWPEVAVEVVKSNKQIIEIIDFYYLLLEYSYHQVNHK